jgi:hypothetical protein
VSKGATTAIRPGRSNDWLKTTCAQLETLPIAGLRWTARTGMGCMSAASRTASWFIPGKWTRNISFLMELEQRRRCRRTASFSDFHIDARSRGRPSGMAAYLRL